MILMKILPITIINFSCVKHWVVCYTGRMRVRSTSDRIKLVLGNSLNIGQTGRIDYVLSLITLTDILLTARIKTTDKVYHLQHKHNYLQ